MAENARPTIRHRRLADELRVLRDRDGRSTREVAEALHWSHTRITRLEAATIGNPPEDTITSLLDAYGAPPKDRKRILALVHSIHAGSWLKPHREILPATLYDYLDLEGDVQALRSYDNDTIPGPLRTNAYMRAVNAARHPGMAADTLDRLVDIHAERVHRLLERDTPPLLWAVIDESVLRRTFGDREVMREQLEHLRKMTSPETIPIVILPLTTPRHPAAGPFTLMTFPGGTGKEIAFTETVTGGAWFEERHELDAVRLAFEQLLGAASKVADTPAIVGSIAGDL